MIAIVIIAIVISEVSRCGPPLWGAGRALNTMITPSPHTKSFPAKSPRVELSGRLPVKLYGHGNSHPL